MWVLWSNHQHLIHILEMFRMRACITAAIPARFLSVFNHVPLSSGHTSLFFLQNPQASSPQGSDVPQRHRRAEPQLCQREFHRQPPDQHLLPGGEWPLCSPGRAPSPHHTPSTAAAALTLAIPTSTVGEKIFLTAFIHRDIIFKSCLMRSFTCWKCSTRNWELPSTFMLKNTTSVFCSGWNMFPVLRVRKFQH